MALPPNEEQLLRRAVAVAIHGPETHLNVDEVRDEEWAQSVRVYRTPRANVAHLASFWGACVRRAMESKSHINATHMIEIGSSALCEPMTETEFNGAVAKMLSGAALDVKGHGSFTSAARMSQEPNWVFLVAEYADEFLGVEWVSITG